MNEILIALLAVAAFVLVVDLVATHLRQRARRAVAASAAPPTGKSAEDRREEGVTVEHE